jgi:ABC-type bacteriocin/lantibiotic exporter with double-glycine peptidase domain
LADALSSLDVLRTSHAGDYLFQRFMRLSAQQSSQAALQRNGQTIQGLLTQVIYIGSSVSLLVVGAYLIFAQNLSVGALVAVSMLNGRTTGVVGQALATLGRWDELTRALQALQPYHQAHEYASPHKNMWMNQAANQSMPDGMTSSKASFAEANPLRHLSGSVQLQAVQHQFTQSRVDVLFPLSLSIAAGSCIGLLGRPGSGKSTLARILVGAIVPSSGQVLLDHRAINSYRRHELAAGLSFKPQEVTLMAGTVEENILMGILSTQNAVRTKALQQGIYFSGLDQDLKSGALSLSQWVEEYGANLSGGQRQKIALARALAHSAKLLVLDEPSNGLDPESEAILITRLKEMTGVTKILVTHSARLLAITERVIALDQGKLLADGPTAQLMAKN